jgi:hypothetical protein
VKSFLRIILLSAVSLGLASYFFRAGVRSTVVATDSEEAQDDGTLSKRPVPSGNAFSNTSSRPIGEFTAMAHQRLTTTNFSKALPDSTQTLSFTNPNWKLVKAKRFSGLEEKLSQSTGINGFEPAENPLPPGCFKGSVSSGASPTTQYEVLMFLIGMRNHPPPINFPSEGWRLDDLSYLHVSSNRGETWSTGLRDNPGFLRTIDDPSNGYFLEIPGAFVVQIFARKKSAQEPSAYIGNLYFYSKKLSDYGEAIPVELKFDSGDDCLSGIGMKAS